MPKLSFFEYIFIPVYFLLVCVFLAFAFQITNGQWTLSCWTQWQKYIYKEDKMVFIINKYYLVYKFGGKRFPQPGQKEQHMRNDFYLTGLWTCLWHVFLIVNWWRRGPPTVDRTIPRQVGLGCMRKLWEQERGNRRQSSLPPQSVPQSLPPGLCVGLLPWLPEIMDWTPWAEWILPPIKM